MPDHSVEGVHSAGSLRGDRFVSVLASGEVDTRELSPIGNPQGRLVHTATDGPVRGNLLGQPGPEISRHARARRSIPSWTSSAGRSTSMRTNGRGALPATWMLPGATRTLWRRAMLTRAVLSSTGNVA